MKNVTIFVYTLEILDMLFALARKGQYKGQIIGRSSQRIFTSGQHKLMYWYLYLSLSIVHCNDSKGKLTHRSNGFFLRKRGFKIHLNAYGEHIKKRQGQDGEVYSRVILNFFYPRSMLPPAPIEN